VPSITVDALPWPFTLTEPPTLPSSPTETSAALPTAVLVVFVEPLTGTAPSTTLISV
jgi:hypothetical protein